MRARFTSCIYGLELMPDALPCLENWTIVSHGFFCRIFQQVLVDKNELKTLHGQFILGGHINEYVNSF